jgi:hypothetical protein
MNPYKQYIYPEYPLHMPLYGGLSMSFMLSVPSPGLWGRSVVRSCIQEGAEQLINAQRVRRPVISYVCCERFETPTSSSRFQPVKMKRLKISIVFGVCCSSLTPMHLHTYCFAHSCGYKRKVPSHPGLRPGTFSDGRTHIIAGLV